MQASKRTRKSERKGRIRNRKTRLQIPPARGEARPSTRGPRSRLARTPKCKMIKTCGPRQEGEREEGRKRERGERGQAWGAGEEERGEREGKEGGERREAKHGEAGRERREEKGKVLRLGERGERRERGGGNNMVRPGERGE